MLVIRNNSWVNNHPNREDTWLSVQSSLGNQVILILWGQQVPYCLSQDIYLEMHDNIDGDLHGVLIQTIVTQNPISTENHITSSALAILPSILFILSLILLLN